MGRIGTNKGSYIRKACYNQGFQSDDPLYFRDSAIYINSDADGYLSLTADTGIKLNAPSVKTYDATITVGAVDTASTVNVAIQLTQGDGSTAVTEAIFFKMYLSSDSVGQTVTATAPSTLAVGTDGTIIIEHTANVYCDCITEADGDFDFDITDTASTARYVNIVLPSGQIVTSSTAITFT